MSRLKTLLINDKYKILGLLESWLQQAPVFLKEDVSETKRNAGEDNRVSVSG